MSLKERFHIRAKGIEVKREGKDTFTSYILDAEGNRIYQMPTVDLSVGDGVQYTMPEEFILKIKPLW